MNTTDSKIAISWYNPTSIAIFTCSIICIVLCVESILESIRSTGKIKLSDHLHKIIMVIAFEIALLFHWLNPMGYRFQQYCYLWAGIGDLVGGLAFASVYVFLTSFFDSRVSVNFHFLHKNVFKYLVWINVLFSSITHGYSDNYCYQPVQIVWYRLAGM